MRLYELFDSDKMSFMEWFDGSITKKGGKPIIFYHGSNKIFKHFTTDYGIRYNTFPAEVPLFFTEDKEVAEDFGIYVYQCFLKITNLFDGEDLVTRKAYDIDEDDMTEIGKKLWNDLNNDKIFTFKNQDNIYPTFIQIIHNEYLIMEKNEMLDWMKDNGFDGFLITGEGRTNWAVFSGKQVWMDRRLS